MNTNLKETFLQDDLLGIWWRTAYAMRLGWSPIEAYTMALSLAGV